MTIRLKVVTICILTVFLMALGCRPRKRQEVDRKKDLNHPALIALHQVLDGPSFSDALEHSVVELSYSSNSEQFTKAEVTIRTDGYLDDTFRGQVFEFTFARKTKDSPWEVLSSEIQDLLWPKLGEVAPQ